MSKPWLVQVVPEDASGDEAQIRLLTISFSCRDLGSYPHPRLHGLGQRLTTSDLTPVPDAVEYIWARPVSNVPNQSLPVLLFGNINTHLPHVTVLFCCDPTETCISCRRTSCTST